MPFTVYRPLGVSDNQFQPYVRLLLQTGHNLGCLRRVPDPATGKRWLHVWDSRQEAQQFADELLEVTGNPPWQVIETHDPISEGPLGPILIQFVRLSTGITFELHSLTRKLLRSAFPKLIPPIFQAKVDWKEWEEYKRVRGNFADLVHQLAPAITGLDQNQLSEIGYAAADCDREESAVLVPPRMPSRNGEIATNGTTESGRSPSGAQMSGTLAETG